MLNKANFEEMMGGNANRRRMRNGGEVPKGYHKMPDGSTMKNSEMDYEGKMVRAQMRKINRYSKDIYNMVEDEAQLEAWVQSKLTKAADYIGMVKHYLRDYKQMEK